MNKSHVIHVEAGAINCTGKAVGDVVVCFTVPAVCNQLQPERDGWDGIVSLMRGGYVPPSINAVHEVAHTLFCQYKVAIRAAFLFLGGRHVDCNQGR